MTESEQVDRVVEQLRDGVHREHAIHNGHRGARFSKKMAQELLYKLNKFARSMPIEKWAEYAPRQKERTE